MSGAPDVTVVATGIANVRSVVAGLARSGARAHVTESARDVRDAARVLLPGVGSFGAAMARLRARELDAALRERIDAGRPTLAICLGLQLLAEGSDESPGVAGLGVLPGRVERFASGVVVPQIGWNSVDAAGEDAVFLREPGWFYFANSFRLVDAPPGWRAACADHGGRFVAALERGEVLACQFHPELSAAAGRRLLDRWIAGGAACSRSA